MSASPKRRIEPHAPLTLPDVGLRGVPAGGLVARATTLTLTLVGVVIAAAVVASFFVTMNITVDGSGTLDPARVWPVRARADGVLIAVLVRTGDTVRAGQPIARLDSAPAHAAIAELTAELGAQHAARVQVAQTAPYQQRAAASAVLDAKAKELRARAALRERLVNFGLGSNIDSVLAQYRLGTHIGLDGAVADVLSARSDSARAKALLDQSALTPLELDRLNWTERQLQERLRAQQDSRARSVIVAPAAGVVLTEGPERLPGAMVHQGETVIELAETTGWRATIAVPERDVHRVHLGSRALLTIPAIVAVRDAPIPGRVVEVAPEALGVGSSLSEAGASAAREARGGPPAYRVVVTLDAATVDSLGPTLLRRGYVVEAKIVTERDRIISLIRSRIRERIRLR